MPKQEIAQLSEESRIKQLEEMLVSQGEQLREMSAALTKNQTLQPKRVIENTARVMFVNDKPVIRFEQTKTVNGNLLAPVVLLTEDGKEEKDVVPYLEMLNSSPRHTVEILKQEAHEVTTHQGPIPQRWTTQPNDPVGLKESGRRYESREMILDHTVVTYTAKIKFLEGPWEGKEIEIDTKCLNP